MDVQIHRVPDPLILPWDGVDSPETKREYRRKSKFFLEQAGYVDPKKMFHGTGPPGIRVVVEQAELVRGMTAFILAARADPSRAKAEVMAFISSQKPRLDAREIGAYHIRNTLKPVKLALELNDVEVSWKKVMRLVPKTRKRGEDREYSLGELKRLSAFLSPYLRVAVLIMMSCGCRVGAFDYLRVGDITPLPSGCGEMVVYAGEGDDRYTTLISLEALRAFQGYVAARRNAGEDVRPDSPALVTREGSRRCSSGTIRNAIARALWLSGVRTERKKRYEVQVDHGLRKFFDNVAKDFMPEDYVEKLIGHDTGTKEHYDRHLPKPLVEAYLKAMPHLSLGDEFRAKAELQESEKKRTDDERETAYLRSELRESNKTLEEVAAWMKEYGPYVSELKRRQEEAER